MKIDSRYEISEMLTCLEGIFHYDHPTYSVRKTEENGELVKIEIIVNNQRLGNFAKLTIGKES